MFSELTQLKAHFRVSYTMMLKRLEQIGKLNYSDFIKKIRWEYKRRNNGQPLTKEIELDVLLSYNTVKVASKG